MNRICSVPEALEKLRSGQMLILIDDEDRENEGDLVAAASLITPEQVNFMAQHARGLICTPLDSASASRLNLTPMVPENTSRFSTAFTVSVEAKEGVSTGISAKDRAHTIRCLSDVSSTASDFVKPGHVFPLIARDGGVLVRAGQTEASVDLCRMAGLPPAAVICEIMNPDGSMSRMPQLTEFASRHDLFILTVEELIRYRLSLECHISRIDEASLPTPYGNFRLTGFEVCFKNEHHLALVMGKWEPDEPVLVRVHSECLTGDTLSSLRCDCGAQLHFALSEIGKAGKGVLVYLRQEGRGIGLLNKIRAYCLQDKGLDTVEANEKLGFKPDARDYGIGAQILRNLGVKKIRLLSNNPRKMVGLTAYGLEITEMVPIRVGENDFNRCYLQTKKDKLGHIL